MHFTNFNVPRACCYLSSLVAFTQHCTRLVQRYLQTGDVKKAKPTGRTLTEDVVENVRGRMNKALERQCESFHSKQVILI
jgi:hypothetical protein